MKTLSNTLQVYRESNGITGITFITPKEEFLSYRDLATNALKFLTYFNKAGLKKDSKLIFQLSYNKNFVHTFWACVAGGIVAVPVTTGNNDEHRQKLFNIYTLLDDAYLIIDSDFLDKLESFAQRNNLMDIFSEIKSKTIDIRSIELETLALGVSIETNQDDLALIQFSSGSTGEPKGVMISANKIIQNGKGVLETSRISKKDSYLSWFPLTHDMGLMGWHINPILLGVNQVLIETNAFIRRPLLWLDCVTKYKSTVLCSPNFGYRYLLKFLKKKQNWDLSSIRLIYNGAEPISVSLCDEFMQTLAPYGLQATTMYPVYGLAEATLGVTVPKVSEFFKRYHLDIKYLSIGEKVRELETDLEAVTYVSVGSPLVNMEIRITHNNQVLDEDFIGHIEIKSVSVTEGYYNNIEVTNSVIKENGWLDTGDLGFMRDGELILTGRAKDIIIKNGINYYPHDIESICCNVEECELNKVVVIGVRSLNQEDEALVVFVLFKKEMKDFIKIEQEIKKVILRKVGLEIFQVIPVKTIYKTTSGKLQRYKFLSKYNNGEFNEVLKELETFDMQEEIFNPLLEHEQILSVLTKEINALLEGDIRIDKPLFEQGLTSITLIVFKEKVSKILKLDIPTMALFDYPTIKDLSDYLFRQSFNTLVPEIRNRRTIEKNTLEATSFQKRLFILSQFQDSANLYNLSLAWKTTQLDINKCQSIFSELLQVHQSLNLNLYIEEGQVYQKINTHEFLIDTQKISSEDVEDIIVEYIQRPFDLEHDLLFKVLILHHNSDDYLILKTHHTIFDGTSANILMRDFKKLYQNEDIVLPHKNYFDFTLDYKERLNLSLIKKQELFWLDKFKTVPSLLTLPTDNMYPSTRTYKGDKVYFKIDQALTKEIKQVAKEYNISINMLLYASFIILLNKITSQEDITVGIPVTTRADTFHNTVGMFINTLAMRQEINNALSIEAYFKQVKKLFLSTLDNIEYPLEDLVEKLKIKKDLARNMLFDVMFAYEDGAERVMDAFNFQKHEIKDKHSDFDLTLEILDESDSLHCSFQYYTEIFKATTIKRFISYYLKILTEIQENKLLKDIDMIPLEEKHLLESFNKTEKVYPKDKTLIELFEEQVAKTPNNIAVVYEEKELSYEELNKRANRLGHYLVEEGVKENDVVAVCMDRSIEMMIGLLGILKSKGAYVPIDAGSPKERIAYMIEDSTAKMVLIEKNLVKEIDTLTERKMIASEDINGITMEYSSNNLNKEVNLNDLAYVIYTSGSTGKPKGTLLTHKNLNNYLYWSMSEYEPKRGKGMPVQSSLAFDATITSLYLPILTGGRTILLAEKEEIEGLSKLLKTSDKVSLIKITPSHLKILNEQLSEGEFADATHALILGGEALSYSDIQPWLKYAPNVNLINEYGPTESVVGCCIYNARGNTRVMNSIPIGKPIANTRLYILNKEKKEQPIGSIGELYIGGDGLARGYLNKPELTEKVFIEHPSLGRIYKTGDMAKYQEDGNIEYLGRVDDQVKIRGFRIELGEIENSILNVKGIKEAVVIAKEEQLIAYVVEDTEGSSNNDKLKERLKSKLPTYMIPSHFVKVEEVPLTPNGKIDKKALASVKAVDSANVYIEASTENEKKLANIFCEVLKIDKVSINDNFFEIGGHSLTAITIIAKMSKEFSVEIKLKELFMQSSIQDLSKLIASKTKVEQLEIKVLERAESYEISNAQRRLWVLDKMQDGTNVYNLPGALSFKNKLNIERIEESLEVLIRRHEILRTNFKEIRGEVRQVINDVEQVKVENIIMDEDEVNEYLEKEAKKVFDLEKDKLIVVKVINNKLLFVNMHHIISDGWSISVIIKELSSIYTALAKKEVVELKELTIQYKEYSYWQNSLLEDKDYLEKHQRYWHNRLKGHTPLEFPLDYTRPSNQKFEGTDLSIKLTKERTNKLKRFSKENTLFTVLLTITNILLAKYSNQEEIIIGTPIANRGHEQLFEQIGFYVNTLALRTKLSMEESFEKNLAKITEETLEAFEHQSYPFDKLVDELELERDLSQNPLFNMMIVLQNNEQSELNFNHNENELKVIDTKSTKFDMSFNYIEVEDELALTVEYNTELFNTTTIERLLVNLETLIDNLTDRSILSEVNIISKEEKSLLQGFNETKKVYPEDKTIIELFEEQVAKNPNNIAVVYEDKEFTYLEINQKANVLGRYLRENYQIKADKIVPIMLDRSEWMIIAILGVLKAGGAYLPIDPQYPEDRTTYMLEDSGATIILHDTANRVNANNYKSLLSYGIIDVQTFSLSTMEHLTNLKIINHVDNLAYVIYTSGSTGKPKGVMLAHRGAVNRIAWMQKKYALDTSDTILQKTPFSFDVSVWELLLPMMYGVKLVFAKPNGHKDNEYLLRLIKKESISFIHFVPSMLSVMLQHSALHTCDSLKNIVCSGEALSLDTVNTFHSNNTKNLIKLHNLYGPTEASIDVTSFYCDKDRDLKSIPIGKAIANTKLYILNQNKEILPIGSIGELYIAGDGLARGYLNKPELTEQVFINHPSLGRIYKTGDMAKYQEDGNIEYLGRVDDQVKIKGFRVELGEIENVISSFDGISDSLVKLYNEQLVAYVIGEKKGLKEYLLDKLPNYMIPLYFLELEQFPLTSNGKVDKKNLPNPKKNEHPKVYRVANTSTEIEVAKIFAETLQVEKISIESNFFDLGGDSLNAINLISHANRVFSKKVQLSHIFNYPTIELFAQALDKIQVEKETTKNYTIFNPDKQHALFIFPTIIATIDHAFLDQMSKYLIDYKIYAFDFIIEENRIVEYAKMVNTLEDEFVFFGYSSGGSLAYEVIKEMEKFKYKLPKKLISLDSWRINKLNYIPADFRVLMIDKAKRHGLSASECHKIVTYMDMIDSTINMGQINVDIDYISDALKSKDEIEKRHEEWASLTTQKVRSFSGFGEHEDMVKKSFLIKNCELIKTSLLDSKFKE